MSLQERLMADLKAAMRERDIERREAIRLLRAAVLNEEIELGHPLNDDEVVRVIDRLVKRHRDSIEQFKRGGRLDLVEHEESQLATISGYLPNDRLTHEEIAARVRAAIAASGARTRGESGKVMQRLAPELRGKADLSEVSRMVLDLLGG